LRSCMECLRETSSFTTVVRRDSETLTGLNDILPSSVWAARSKMLC
jgi:hypothetical protein